MEKDEIKYTAKDCAMAVTRHLMRNRHSPNRDKELKVKEVKQNKLDSSLVRWP
jgi:hypothetical protein